MSSTFLEVENLSKRFGGLRAIDNITFSVGRDEMVGLIGPNGAGKTTLLRLILGFLKPDAGRTRFKGEDITGERPWTVVGRGIAGTFQTTKPFHHLPVVANVVVPCMCPRTRKRGQASKSVEARAREALEFCGIADLALEKASSLSQGDLKRLEVAKVIATEPELAILDEPFGGLSPSETSNMATSIRGLHEAGGFNRKGERGPAIVMIEHKLGALMQVVDRVIVLNFGQIIADGTPAEIVKNERVIEAYTGRREPK